MALPQLIGPFRQLLPFSGLAPKGPLADEQQEIIEDAGIVFSNGRIEKVGLFADLQQASEYEVTHLSGDQVALPGFIDAHTHLCYIGSRATDYASRLAGRSYLDIAKAGGGIRFSMQHTRAASEEELVAGMRNRLTQLYRNGITTVEVKTGYGLSTESELRMLRAIRKAQEEFPIDLIPTCLAAHIVPDEFAKDEAAYLDYLLTDLLPQIKEQGLANRIDIFVEDTAFSMKGAERYLGAAKDMGFDLTVHADQFTPGSSRLAVAMGARSADHLEVSREQEIEALAQSDTVAVALPGASLGLGEPFAPARRLLDAGACVAIASDWNPGSAPGGDLLSQAAILGAFEQLTMTETLAGVTTRAARALGLNDRGRLMPGLLADMVVFPTHDYRDILYHQGRLRPSYLYKNGQLV